MSRESIQDSGVGGVKIEVGEACLILVVKGKEIEREKWGIRKRAV